MSTRTVLFLIILLAVPAMAQEARLVHHDETKPSRALTFNLVDNRQLITQDIDHRLVLRVTKDHSAGWEVAVVHKPYADSEINLLYQSLAWHGPHPSEIEAWQIDAKYFPNPRQLDVSGYPYKVGIELIDPVVEGKESSARFVSGTVRISWSRTSVANPPAQRLPETSTAKSLKAQRTYVLRAWEKDGHPNTYVWSIEDQSQSDSPGTIYESLSSPSLRAKVGAFPAGTRVLFHFSGGGSMETVNTVMGKDFDDFQIFCQIKRVVFDFIINTN